MIDIHTHLLPGIDDGAADMQDSLDLAHAAVAEGITDIIVTPHHANGKYMNTASDVMTYTRALQERLREEAIPLTLHAGQEIRVHLDMLDALHRKELLTLGGSSYILLEMPTNSIPERMAEWIHELIILGLKPIIAHPERNVEAVQHPERFAELIELGAYGQVTTHSLLGGFGRKIEQTAWQMCRDGLIHIISSDAHHLSKRGFRMGEAYARVEDTLGAEWRDCFINNAKAVLSNEQFFKLPQSKSIKKPNRLWKGILKFF